MSMRMCMYVHGPCVSICMCERACVYTYARVCGGGGGDIYVTVA